MASRCERSPKSRKKFILEEAARTDPSPGSLRWENPDHSEFRKTAVEFEVVGKVQITLNFRVITVFNTLMSSLARQDLRSPNLTA